MEKQVEISNDGDAHIIGISRHDGWLHAEDQNKNVLSVNVVSLTDVGDYLSRDALMQILREMDQYEREVTGVSIHTDSVIEIHHEAEPDEETDTPLSIHHTHKGGIGAFKDAGWSYNDVPHQPFNVYIVRSAMGFDGNCLHSTFLTIENAEQWVQEYTEQAGILVEDSIEIIKMGVGGGEGEGTKVVRRYRRKQVWLEDNSNEV